jgi:hypothetical protein
MASLTAQRGALSQVSSGMEEMVALLWETFAAADQGELFLLATAS